MVNVRRWLHPRTRADIARKAMERRARNDARARSPPRNAWVDAASPAVPVVRPLSPLSPIRAQRPAPQIRVCPCHLPGDSSGSSSSSSSSTLAARLSCTSASDDEVDDFAKTHGLAGVLAEVQSSSAALIAVKAARESYQAYSSRQMMELEEKVNACNQSEARLVKLLEHSQVQIQLLQAERKLDELRSCGAGARVVGPDDRTDAEQEASDAVRVAQFTKVLDHMTSKASRMMKKVSGEQQERITSTGATAVEECRQRNLAAEGQCKAITERLLASHDLTKHDASRVWALQAAQHTLMTKLLDQSGKCGELQETARCALASATETVQKAHAEQDKLAGEHTEALKVTAAVVRQQLADNLQASFDAARHSQNSHTEQATRCIDNIVSKRRHLERHLEQYQAKAVSAVEEKIQEGLQQLDDRRDVALGMIAEAVREFRLQRRDRRKEPRREESRSPSRRHSRKRHRRNHAGWVPDEDEGSCSRLDAM
jgi:hypothetical protein